MKFPNFNMNKSFTARALVLLAGLFLMAASISAQTKIDSTTSSLGLDIEQCGNGSATANPPVRCDHDSANDGYTRGQLGAGKSHYKEGDSVPIRVVLTGATPGQQYTVTVGYDYTTGGHYANDYLTTYDRTENVSNNPCADVVGCSSASPDNLTAIPLDPDVANGFDKTSGTADDITQIPGFFTCFGCDINAVSGYTLTGSTTSDSTKTITITFTVRTGLTTAVIAYGSHISTRKDWGIDHSAISIHGSSYHNFISGFTGGNANNGNRDLQMSASTVLFPASVTIIKLVENVGFSDNFHDFGFTSTNFGHDTFNLRDTDNTEFGGGSITNPDIENFTAATGTITVTEDDTTGTGYSFSKLECDVQPGGLSPLGTAQVSGRTATIVPAEGNIITCTYTNTALIVTAAPATVSGRVTTAYGNGISGVSVGLTDLTTGKTRYALTNSFGYYTFTNCMTEDFYFVGIESKRYRFATNQKSFTLLDNLFDMDFVAKP